MVLKVHSIDEEERTITFTSDSNDEAVLFTMTTRHSGTLTEFRRQYKRILKEKGQNIKEFSND